MKVHPNLNVILQLLTILLPFFVHYCPAACVLIFMFFKESAYHWFGLWSVTWKVYKWPLNLHIEGWKLKGSMCYWITKQIEHFHLHPVDVESLIWCYVNVDIRVCGEKTVQVTSLPTVDEPWTSTGRETGCTESSPALWRHSWKTGRFSVPCSQVYYTC